MKKKRRVKEVFTPPILPWGDYTSERERSRALTFIMKTNSNSMAAKIFGTTSGTIARYRNDNKIPAGYLKRKREEREAKKRRLERERKKSKKIASRKVSSMTRKKPPVPVGVEVKPPPQPDEQVEEVRALPQPLATHAEPVSEPELEIPRFEETEEPPEEAEETIIEQIPEAGVQTEESEPRPRLEAPAPRLSGPMRLRKLAPSPLYACTYVDLSDQRQCEYLPSEGSDRCDLHPHEKK